MQNSLQADREQSVRRIHRIYIRESLYREYGVECHNSLFSYYNSKKDKEKRMIMKRLTALLLSGILCMQMMGIGSVYAAEEGLEVAAPSAILMEASTGQIIFERNPDEKLPPASVTKVMTMLLIFDALHEGKIKLEESVPVSEYAASMGGSQVFLEPGETQNVDTMLKCIAVASANDACVAMAEYISGSEKEFVAQMNKRAQGLGMKNTHFVNCNGLDAEGHLTTARDIACMSQELITKYPKVHDYTQIWMENITHTTKKGTTEFGLSNTNKLIRHYEYATGLKTGSTSKAKFCLSATAEKDGLSLIAVVMKAPDAKQRVKDSITLLNYGFGKCKKYTDEEEMKLKPVKVKHGIEQEIGGEKQDVFTYVDTKGNDLTKVEKKVRMKKELEAPIKKGAEIGTICYYLNGEEIGRVSVTAEKKIQKMDYPYALKRAAESFLL